MFSELIQCGTLSYLALKCKDMNMKIRPTAQNPISFKLIIGNNIPKRNQHVLNEHRNAVKEIEYIRGKYEF